MSVWKTKPVTEQPEITLTRWGIFETPEGDRHFYGYHYAGMEGRVSSKILEFDPIAQVGKTKSGRVYKLEGESGSNPDAEYVLGVWKQVNNVKDVKPIDIKNEE